MRVSPIVGLFAALLVPAAAAVAAAPAPAGRQCFYTRDWRGWRAADPEGTAMYVRVGVSRVYRVEFAGTCRQLTSPSARLVTESTFGQVCSAVDLTVKVSDSSGLAPTPCIVKGLTALTPAEVAQLPKKLVP
jgi:hypothetical protein